MYTMTSVASGPSSAARPHAQLPSKGGSAPGTLYVAGMVAATFVLLLSPVSSVLLYGFPLMSLVVATYLYRRNLPLYVSLVCWLWFLTPFVRRVVDYPRLDPGDRGAVSASVGCLRTRLVAHH